MGALKLTACMKVVAKMSDMDQESLLERLDRYTDDGVPKDRAQVMAASDALAELQAERREFMAMLRQQHPDLFVVTNEIPEDQDVDPDAPDIQRSAARDITDTPEFKRWFGDSKVVDADGRPLVVYHGTAEDFAEFDPSRTGRNYFSSGAKRGLFFTSNPGTASVYAEQPSRAYLNPANPESADFGKGTANIMPVYLSLENPLVISTKKSPDKFFDGKWEDIFRRVDERGHDGVIVRGGSEFKRELYVAVKPEQIKSAIGNNGQFDPNSADITRSPARDVTATPEFKRWFDGSKVVDEQGNPQVVYHGTIVRSMRDGTDMGDITAFDRMFTTRFRRPSIDTVGSWFSTNPGEGGAGMYAGNGQGSAIYPVYLSIKSPQVTTFQLMQRRARLLANGKDDGRAIGAEEVQAYRDWLEATGKDGIKIEGSGNEGSTEFDNQVAWIALEPTQIKSSIGNDGSFDLENADIRRSPARTPSEIFGREIAPEAIKAYKSLSIRAKSVIDGWNVNWSIGQGRLRNSDEWAEIQKAYEPVREKLRQVYGETVPAYRGEQEDRGDRKASGDDRFLFSWTPMRDVATGFAINRRWGLPSEITQAQVDEQIEAYRKTGIARLNGYKFVRKDPGGFEPDGPDYYYIYQRGEMQTDGDDIAQALQSEKDERDEWLATLRESGKLYTANIPVDSVAFIPVNANLRQPEFVAEYNPRKDEAEEIKFSPARDMTDTPEFKAWFGDSQVVDESGKPKVVYHSTNAIQWGATDLGFSEFLTKDSEIGAHFGTIEQANSFGNGERRRVMPVYLSVKNPLRLEDRGGFGTRVVADQLIDMGIVPSDGGGYPSDSDIPRVQAAIKDAGYDGIVYLNRREGFDPFGPDGVSGDELDEMTDREVMDTFPEAQDSWIVFEPEQVKSAIGNRGTFDPNDADITRSPGRTATGAAWDSPSASKWDDAVYKMQDKQVDLKRVTDAIQEAGGAIADDLNVYLQEELYHGRAAKRTEDFVNLELNPLVEQLAKDGLELSDLEEFLHARHAPEANAVIAQRNPGEPGLQDGGSGMKTADAMNYMAGLPADLRQKLEAAAAKVDDILKSTREMYVDYELESRDTVDAWGKMFQHYIPLMREDKDGNGSPGIGQGFSIKGKEVKGRTGSTRKVVDILANIALQRERAIVRGEKNRVSQALVGLASSNPNEGFWVVDEVPTERVFNEKTGLVEDRVDPMYKSRPNAVIAKIKDGSGKVKEHAVLFNEEDERAMRMAAALKNLDAANLEGLMGVSAMISRYFAASVTQWNPLFGPVNMIRDVQAVALNLSSTPIKGEERKVMRNVMPALAGVYKDLRAARKGKTTNTQWAKLWEEFQDVGGQTGYRDLFRNSEERANAIKKVLDPDAWADTKLGKIFTAGGALKVPLAQARRAAAWIFDWLSDYNDALENGVRLAVYKAALDRGLSKEQAASIAKNASTNFNRKGQIGQQAGALYAFFNAAVQGTARIGDTLFDMEPGKPKTLRLSSAGKKIVGGGVLLGAIQALMLAAAGYDDEDPPQFARERSIIIPIGDKKYISIPMPLGFNVIPNIGRIATEFALGGFKDPHERAVQLISLFSETFNPIGSAGLSMQTLAPTALDPLVALTENKDWTGKPIARESSNPATPGHALAKDTATTWSKAISEAINTLSGGNKYVAGVFSPTPDQIDYLLGWATGGVGREISKLDQTVTAAVYGEELPPYKIPLVGRFYGNARSQASEGSAFYANTQDLNKLETEIKGLEKDGKRAEAQELRRSRSEAYLITAANQAERQVQRLRQQKRELIKNDAPREQVQAVETQITTVMARLNRAMEALEQKQK